MDTKRQQKFARLIQKDLAEIFQQDVKHLFENLFITVTTVRVSPDLGVAKVYLSFLLAKNKEEAIENIKDQTKTIRQILAQKIKNQVRVIPELHFFLDDSEEYAAKINALLEGLNNPSNDLGEEKEEEK
jgi:ribosome-binding factor A